MLTHNATRTWNTFLTWCERGYNSNGGISFAWRARRMFLAKEIRFTFEKKKEPNAPLGVSSCIYSLETQTHSEVALQNQPDNIIYAPFPWLLRWRDPILPNSHTKNTYTFWLPVGHTVAEGFGNHTSSFLHSFNLLVAKSCIHVCLCVSGLVNRSNWSYVTRPRTSKARSLRPLKIENSAGNVQPLFSVKKRKNDLNNRSNSQEVKCLKARAE